jgi:hypothetical protein
MSLQFYSAINGSCYQKIEEKIYSGKVQIFFIIHDGLQISISSYFS